MLFEVENILLFTDIFMGTVDSGDLPQSFDKVETICDNNTGEKMVHLMECQNTQTSSLNGVHQISSSTADICPDSDKISVTNQNKATQDDAWTKENSQNRKRKLDGDVVEPNNKRSKNGDVSLEELENTGRGKRIKKLKRSFYYDDMFDEIDHLPSKKSDRRFVGDSEDKEYVPTQKLPRSENRVATVSNKTFSSLNSASAFGSSRSLSNSEPEKSIVEETTNVTNVEEDGENVTIIEIPVSEEEEGGACSTEDSQDTLSKTIDKSRQESAKHVNQVGRCANRQDFTDISIAIETYNSADVSPKSSSPKPCNVDPVLADVITNQPDSQSTLIQHINTLVNSKLHHNPVKMVRPPFPAEVFETNPVTSTRPQKKLSKKSSKKTHKKNFNKPDLMLDEAELRHLNKLKSMSVKRTEKASDGSKQTMGPYIQCRGQKDSLKLCRVVNVKDSQDADHAASNPAKYSMLPRETCSNHASSRMNENVPWKCILCSKGSSYMHLGDLFGPYFPQQPTQTSSATNGEPKTDNSNPLEKSLSGSCILPNGLPTEIWVHCDCAIWTNGILVSGGKLRGLEEAALAAQQSVGDSLFVMAGFF